MTNDERRDDMGILSEHAGYLSEHVDLEELEAPAYEDLHSEDEVLWSEILPGLWQGGTDDFDLIETPHKHREDKPWITVSDFDTVVTLYADANPADWFVREIRYGFWDHDTEHFDTEELFDLVRIAHQDWKRGKRVLIRCQAGWNRSGLITALVLIREGIHPRTAIDLQRERRNKWVLCNENFEQWLLKQNSADWQGERYGV
jgi:hypothetical protein